MAQKRISDFFGGPKSLNSRCTSTSVVDESGAVAISSEDSEQEEEGLVELPVLPRLRGDGDPSSNSIYFALFIFPLLNNHLICTTCPCILRVA